MTEKIRIHFIYGPIKVKQGEGYWYSDQYPNEQMMEALFEDKEYNVINLDEATSIVWYTILNLVEEEITYKGVVWFISPEPGGCIKYTLKTAMDLQEAENRAKKVAEHLEEQYKLNTACKSLE